MDPLLFQTFIYLAAALTLVPVARAIGLGSVLGYLLAGLIIGPSLLGLVGADEQVMHFAELGVVMMLFLVGLELEPARLWRLRVPIVGMGGIQMGATALLTGAASVGLGLPWREAVAVGLIVAMSSTAIALQSLTERGLLRSEGGQRAFSVLLFQDIAIIPILAGLPLLASLAVEHGDAGHGADLLEGLSPIARTGTVLGAILAVIFAGRVLVRPILRVVARTHLRELFTAAALALVIGVTLLMAAVGLSPALGTFLAGVVLASSEYRHELESDLEPIKGLLLGLFFMAVGASLDLGLVAANPLGILALTAGIIGLKIAVLYPLARGFGLRPEQAVMFGLSLGQVGEFAFVLLAFAAGNGVLPEELTRTLTTVTALSMAASPVWLALGERVIVPRLTPVVASGREADVQDDESAVIIAGFGRFGQIAGRFLRANGVGVTVLDVDSDQVDIVRRFGQHVYFGDASRVGLLHAAGAERAKILILAVDKHEKVLEIARVAREHFPHLHIVARARGRTEAYELIDLGITDVYRETFDTSLRLGSDVLTMLGAHPYRAHRAARTFRDHDEATVVEFAAARNNRDQLVRTSRERIRELERTLQADAEDAGELANDAWDEAPERHRDTVRDS